MTRRILALGSLAALLALALTTAGAAAPGDDCATAVPPPSSFYGVDVIAYGELNCAAAKNTIRITLVLTRDGVTAATSERTCHKAATCWTYAVAPDPADSGDQTYCTQFSARVGPQTLATTTTCESDPVP